MDFTILVVPRCIAARWIARIQGRSCLHSQRPRACRLTLICIFALKLAFFRMVASGTIRGPEGLRLATDSVMGLATTSTTAISPAPGFAALRRELSTARTRRFTAGSLFNPGGRANSADVLRELARACLRENPGLIARAAESVRKDPR
jgi:hypothetical protein